VPILKDPENVVVKDFAVTQIARCCSNGCGKEEVDKVRLLTWINQVPLCSFLLGCGKEEVDKVRLLTWINQIPLCSFLLGCGKEEVDKVRLLTWINQIPLCSFLLTWIIIMLEIGVILDSNTSSSILPYSLASVSQVVWHKWDR
jgi:hypothetical protein